MDCSVKALNEAQRGRLIRGACGINRGNVPLLPHAKLTHRTCAFMLLVPLLLSVIQASPPQFMVGPRLTAGFPTSGMDFYDSAGRRIFGAIEEQPYLGIGVDVEYGPVALMRFGLELGEVRIYTHGGYDFSVFPLGGEVSVEAPFPWRFLPFLFVGGSYSTNFLGNSSLQDSTTMIAPPEGSLRAGLGCRYAVSKRIDLCAAVQAFSLESRRDYVPPYFVVQTVTSVFGFDRAQIGARVVLGR